jgi:hypothetical protein
MKLVGRQQRTEIHNIIDNTEGNIGYILDCFLALYRCSYAHVLLQRTTLTYADHRAG